VTEVWYAGQRVNSKETNSVQTVQDILKLQAKVGLEKIADCGPLIASGQVGAKGQEYLVDRFAGGGRDKTSSEWDFEILAIHIRILLP
jgi:hypothetical protein